MSLSSALEDGLPKLLGDQTNSEFKGFAPDSAYSEDRSAFGDAGWLVFLPLLAYCLLAPGMRGSFRTIAAASVLYLVAFALFKRYDEFVGRLLCRWLRSDSVSSSAVQATSLVRNVSALALLPLFPVLFENPNKPLLDKGRSTNVFGLDRTQQQALARPSFKPVIPAT